MDSLLQDIRFAVRSLLKAPLVTTLCVLCLSIGIGLNTNIYSAVYAVFFRPLGFAEPERLLWIDERNDARGLEDFALAYETFDDARGALTDVPELAAIGYRSLTLSDSDEPVRLQGAVVSWNLFRILGVQPHLGRHFREDEDRRGAPGVLMLGYGIWQERYGADSAIIGRSVIMNGQPHTIIGVMPQGFMFPFREEAWAPIAPLLDGSAREAREVSVIGKLRPGATLATANAQLRTFSQRLAAQFPESNEGWRAESRQLHSELMDAETKLVIGTMMGAVTFVLLIACANVANLLLARATTRTREIAIRAALGAGRGRIVRQLLTESVVLALVAMPVGIWIAFVLLDLVKASIPPNDMPYYVIFEIDGPVLLYSIGLALVTGLVFGLAPALQAARGDLQGQLKDGGRGSGTGHGKQRLRSSLAVAEVALSLVLLVGASLFVRSFMNLQQKTGGIDSANLLTMRFFMPGARYDSGRAIAQRVQDVVERVEALPGVEYATVSNLIPLDGGGSGGVIEIEGKPVVNRAQAPRVFWAGVTEHWFRALGVPFVAGRALTAQESRDSSEVAVVNQTMAQRFWPDVDAIGRRFALLDGDRKVWFTIVGITRDFKDDDLDDAEGMDPAFFVSYRYMQTRNSGLVVRADGDPAQLASAVRGVLRESDPTMPVFAARTMEEVRRTGMWSQRLFGWLFSLFGIVAVILASVGVYGVIAFGVSQRTQEIGVRIALGAQPADVIRMVVRGGATLALVGIAIGLAAAAGVTRVIQSLLIDVSSTDPVSFVAVTAFLSAVALLASYVPARRATRVNPVTALRND